MARRTKRKNKRPASVVSVILAAGFLSATGFALYEIAKNLQQNKTNVFEDMTTSEVIRITTYTVKNDRYDYTSKIDYDIERSGFAIIQQKHVDGKTAVFEGTLPLSLTDQVFDLISDQSLQKYVRSTSVGLQSPGEYLSIFYIKNSVTQSFLDIAANDDTKKFNDLIISLKEQIPNLSRTQNIIAFLVASPDEGLDTSQGSGNHHIVVDRRAYEQAPSLQMATKYTWRHIPIRNKTELELIQKYVKLETERGGERYVVTTPNGKFDLGLLVGGE